MTQTALVTGASTGIGLEIARILAAGGNNLILVARNGEALNTLAGELQEKHKICVTSFVEDLSDPRTPMKICQEITNRKIEIDVLVNNAGVGVFGEFANTDLTEHLRLLSLNMMALTEFIGLLLPGMLERKRGHILNVASTAAFQPGPLMATYYASKAYVLSFSEALANEVKGKGVTVTALCPGPTRTEFQQRAGMQKSGLFKRLIVMDAETVARAGVRGMMNGKTLVVPGVINKLTAFATRFAPRSIAAAMARALQQEVE